MKSYLIIVDTDPGVDDLLAIIYMKKRNLPICALTTVHGNSTIDNVTDNAIFLSKKLKLEVGVYKGSSISLDGNSYSSTSSGEKGFGSMKIPKQQNEQDMEALEYLADQLAKEKTTIFCLGPLTNIALLMNMHPDLLGNISNLIIMAGEFTGNGNISKYAEFNAYCDPSALRIVMNTCFQRGINAVVIPADVCRQALFTYEEIIKLGAKDSLPELGDIVRPYIDYYLTNKEYGQENGAVIYDLLVPMYSQHPEFFQVKRGRIEVETDQNIRHGETTFIPDEKSSILLAYELDGEKVKEEFFSNS